MNSKPELTSLLPRNRDDVENAKAIVALGFPEVQPVLPSLFQWLETSGSKVELIIRPFFASLGDPAFDLVQKALQTTVKPARQECLLRFVLPHWPAETLAKLLPELMALLGTHGFHALDVWALKLLLDKGLGDQAELERWRKHKAIRLTEQLNALTCGPTI